MYFEVTPHACSTIRIIKVGLYKLILLYPLVFSVTGGAAPEARTFLKILCDRIASKNGQEYASVVNFIKCKIGFVIRKLILLCIRGSRSAKKMDTSPETDFEYGCFVSKL